MLENIQKASDLEIKELPSDQDLEQMAYGPSACSVGSVPNTCQMQSNKY